MANDWNSIKHHFPLLDGSRQLLWPRDRREGCARRAAALTGARAASSLTQRIVNSSGAATLRITSELGRLGNHVKRLADRTPSPLTTVPIASFVAKRRAANAPFLRFIPLHVFKVQRFFSFSI
jgi:hypothetical protein